MRICTVVGTRPNFMKVAPLIEEFLSRGVEHVLIHTGQHYDKEMSDLFFEQLGMPEPDINLGVGSGSYGEQLAGIIRKLEEALKKVKPDLVVVVGDVNSTLAGALVAKQLGIPVAHVEAGLRSFDMTMPEEINRMLTDRISDYLFTTEENAGENLKREGVPSDRIHFVGNVMIDTLLKHREKASSSDIQKKLGVKKGEYCVLTLHRPGNVDGRERLTDIIDIIASVQERKTVIFPVHPRTKQRLKDFGQDQRLASLPGLKLIEPQGYLDFLNLMDGAALILTDSGGIQEESTVLGVPCITIRDNTERPVTTIEGTNLLVSAVPDKVIKAAEKALEEGRPPHPKTPKLWDGKAAGRIVAILLDRNRA